MASAKEVKSFLKSKGIETSKIRVSNEISSIRVKLLDPCLDFDQIESLLQEEFESYQRDEATGEILSGGNTFVFVDFDYDLEKEVQFELEPTVRPFLEKCEGRWSMELLVKHYVESSQSEYNKRILKRAIRNAFHKFLQNEPCPPNLIIENF